MEVYVQSLQRCQIFLHLRIMFPQEQCYFTCFFSCIFYCFLFLSLFLHASLVLLSNIQVLSLTPAFRPGWLDHVECEVLLLSVRFYHVECEVLLLSHLAMNIPTLARVSSQKVKIDHLNDDNIQSKKVTDGQNGKLDYKDIFYYHF